MTKADKRGQIGQTLMLGVAIAFAGEVGTLQAQSPAGQSVITQTSLNASAVYRGMDDWSRMRTALSRLPNVAVSITAISVDGALIQFTFAGGFADLQAILARAGLELTMESGGAVVRLVAS